VNGSVTTTITDDDTAAIGLISTATGYQQISPDPKFLISEGDIMRIDLDRQSVSGFEYLDEPYSGDAAASVPASTPVLFGKVQNIDAMHLMADGKLVFSLNSLREVDASSYKVSLTDANLDLWVYNPNASGNKVSVYGQFNARNSSDFKSANVDALHILDQDKGVLLSFDAAGSISNVSGPKTSYQKNDIVLWNGSTASIVFKGADYLQTSARETAIDKGDIDALHVTEFSSTGGLRVMDGQFIRSMVVSTNDPFVVKLSNGAWTSQFSYGDLVRIVFNDTGAIQTATSIYLEDPNGRNTGNPRNIDAYTEKQVVSSGPIAIDLDTSGGVDYLSSSESSILWDFGGGLSQSAWIGPADGLLVYDYDSDGLALEAREFVLSRWGNDPAVMTDLQALVTYFDATKDLVFDARDDAWASFKIWQDANSNGISEIGEMNALSDYGILGFDLNYNADSVSSTQGNGGVYVYGQINMMYSDGSVGVADDMEFIVSGSEPVSSIGVLGDSVPQNDPEASLEQFSQSDLLTFADLVDQFITDYPVSVDVLAEYQREIFSGGDLTASEGNFDPTSGYPTVDAISELDTAEDVPVNMFFQDYEYSPSIADDSSCSF
jgi:hypothetical protein